MDAKEFLAQADRAARIAETANRGLVKLGAVFQGDEAVLVAPPRRYNDHELGALRVAVARMQRVIALELRRRKKEKKEAKLCGK